MMLILDNILNEIDEEWDVPVEINHHYDMAIFNESMSSDINSRTPFIGLLCRLI